MTQPFPRKAISLWDMISTNVFGVLDCHGAIQCYQLLCGWPTGKDCYTVPSGGVPVALWDLTLVARRVVITGSKPASLEHIYKIRDLLNRISVLGQTIPLELTLPAASNLDERLAMAVGAKKKHPAPCSYTEISTSLDEVLRAFEKDLSKIVFVPIAYNRHQYFEKEHLFGHAVTIAFPSAAAEIKSAGNCLAAELHTAAVFHLMRVVEVGLRAIAKRLRVRVGNGPLDYQTWGTIINGIQSALNTSTPPNSAGLKKRAKFLEFSSGVMGEFNAFKDLWRNNVMHTRDSYDEHQAMSAFNHVRGFMQRLAERIKE
jgi:hypothetical protein